MPGACKRRATPSGGMYRWSRWQSYSAPSPYDAGSTCSLQDPTWFVLKAMFAMAYLPKEKLVIEADRFTRPAPSLGARARRPARA